MAWRDVASATNERSAIPVVLPPRSAAKHKAPTVWGGSLDALQVLALAGLLSSFTFDFLLRFRGAGSLTYGIMNSVPAPTFEDCKPMIPHAARVVCSKPGFEDLWDDVGSGAAPTPDVWGVGAERAAIDALAAKAYGLSLFQFAAVLCAFPNVDRSQPMLPGEPKAFVTRDLALLAFSELMEIETPDVAKLMVGIGVDLPEPAIDLRRVDARIQSYRELGAVPYRPTPKGAKPPTDPALIADVSEILSSDSATVSDIADALEQDETTIAAVVKKLEKEGIVFREGKGKQARYYVVEENE